MKKVAIVSCDKWKGIIKEDLLVQKGLLESGINCEIISWEDEMIDYSCYDMLVLRSVWGYQDKYDDFKKWLMYLQQNKIKIYNDVDMILNNVCKDEQFKILDKYNLPCIPTSFIKKQDDFPGINPFEEKMVVKPIISGSGHNTYVVGDQINYSEIPNVFKELFKVSDNGIMLQPYLEGIKDGEYALIYINGVNTHNMLRFPGVFAESRKPTLVKNVPEQVKSLGDAVSNIPEFKNYLYMRVDIAYHEGKCYIMEVELAEPDLLLKYIDDLEVKQNATKVFTREIIRRV